MSVVGLALFCWLWVSLLGAALWAVFAWERRRKDDLPAGWESMDGGQREAWARHPVHRFRCSCRRYGLPDEQVVWRDAALVLHGVEHCQPEREALL